MNTLQLVLFATQVTPEITKGGKKTETNAKKAKVPTEVPTKE